MKKIYLLETGDFRKQVVASCFNEAIVSAFAVNPPKNPGLLIRVKMKNPVKGNKEHYEQSKWHYLDIRKALEIAGYSVDF